MCPCPILPFLWGQQLVTFEATPWLVSHLCCLLVPFDWQPFKATPCLVSHLPFALSYFHLDETIPCLVRHLHCQSFALPPTVPLNWQQCLATLWGDAKGCQPFTVCPFLGKSLRKHTNCQWFAFHSFGYLAESCPIFYPRQLLGATLGFISQPEKAVRLQYSLTQSKK